MGRTDEKIQNDVRDDNVERTKENHGRGETATIGFPIIGSRGAEWRQQHAVVHDFIPIFSSYDPEQNHDTSRSAAEIGLPTTAN